MIADFRDSRCRRGERGRGGGGGRTGLNLTGGEDIEVMGVESGGSAPVRGIRLDHHVVNGGRGVVLATYEVR
jgi:hypothetical protein